MAVPTATRYLASLSPADRMAIHRRDRARRAASTPTAPPSRPAAPGSGRHVTAATGQIGRGIRRISGRGGR